MTNILKNKIVLLIILILWIFPVIASANYQESTVGGTLEAEVKPKEPKPNEMITVKLKGFGFNLNLSKVTWAVNDEVLAEGIGLAEFSFRNGRVGWITSVDAIITTPDNRFIVKNLTFRPAEVELLFEANSFIPNWYRGAALPTAGSLLTVMAEPNIRVFDQLIDARELVFEWTRNNTRLTGSSGLGRNTITFTLNPETERAVVGVKVSHPSSGITASGNLTINANQAEILLYEVKPLSGVNQAKVLNNQNHQAEGDVISLKAEPFYFPINDVLSQLQYIWKAGEEVIKDISSRQREITFQTNQSSAGSSIISVEVNNPRNPKQTGQASVNLNLNEFFGQ
ncbi:MAG: hypothetical protein WDZ85_03170 [Candidatus Paceibacterota bacterium]